MEGEVDRLLIKDFIEIKKLKMGQGVWKDGKKVEKLLGELCSTVNRLVKGAIMQTKLTATELVARPTYAEEFANIKDNVNKAIRPTKSEAGTDEWENISHYSKRSFAHNDNVPVPEAETRVNSPPPVSDKWAEVM